MDCNRFGYRSGEEVYRCVMTSNPKGRLSLDRDRFDISWERPSAVIGIHAQAHIGALMNKMTYESFAAAQEFKLREGIAPNLIVATALESIGLVNSVARLVPPEILDAYSPNRPNPRQRNDLKNEGVYSVILAQSDKGDLVVGNQKYSPIWISHPSGPDAVIGARMVEDALTTTRDFLEKKGRLPSSIVAMALEGISTIWTSAK